MRVAAHVVFGFTMCTVLRNCLFRYTSKRFKLGFRVRVLSHEREWPNLGGEE